MMTYLKDWNTACECVTLCMYKSKIFLNKQESPPAWTQEVYRPRRIKYSICCPTLGGTRSLVPLVLTWVQSLGYSPRKDMEPVEVLCDGDGDRVPLRMWTDWKHNLPSHTTNCGRWKWFCDNIPSVDILQWIGKEFFHLFWENDIRQTRINQHFT